MSDTVVSSSLCGWSVICLRPREDQAAAAHAIAAFGAVPIALPGLRLEPPDDAEAAAAQLRDALACDAVVFTSPAAVRFAARLLPFSYAGEAFAVGIGTARALAAHGIDAHHPNADAMHSEGLLALPAFADRSGTVGLVTAPGGRGVLLRTLSERGIGVRVAHVYRRLPPQIEAADLAALLASSAPRAVLLTSGEALHFILDALPAPARQCLLDAVAMTSSPRLADAARGAGFTAVLQATSPESGTLLDALARHHVTSSRPPAT